MTDWASLRYAVVDVEGNGQQPPDPRVYVRIASGLREQIDGALDVAAVFYLASSKTENLVARLQRRALKDNRLDDANLDIIRQRLKIYEKETRPVLKFYGKTLVHNINTDGSPPQTFFNILKRVVKLKNL